MAQGSVGETRSAASVFLLSIATLGIYAVIFQHKSSKELKDLCGRGIGGGLGLVVIAVLLVSACSHSPHVASFSVGAPESYVAVRTVADHPPFREVIGVTATSSGRLLRQLHTVPWDGMQVGSMAVDGEGRVWVTLSKGPTLQNGTAGGDPKPGSCRSEVVRIDPSGATHVVLRGGSDSLISRAIPSPDGSRLAYLTGGCATSFLDQSIRVDDLGSKRHLTIGAGVAPCHEIGVPRWSLDGRRLAFAYGPPDPHAADRAGSGSGLCSSPLPSRLAVVSADHTQAGISGSTQEAPDHDCEIVAATPDAVGFAAIEACGGREFLSGPARLLRYSSTLRLLGRTSIGRCADGAEITTDHAGTHLLISSYQFCNPPGTTDPRTVVYTAAAGGGAASLRGTHPGGFANHSDIAW